MSVVQEQVGFQVCVFVMELSSTWCDWLGDVLVSRHLGKCLLQLLSDGLVLLLLRHQLILQPVHLQSGECNYDIMKTQGNRLEH